MNYVMDLVRKYDIHPQRSAGQNFLLNEAALKKIVATAELTSVDRVLEVGPGLGVLTRQLVAAAGTVVAVELDRTLFSILEHEFQGVKNLQLINRDILKVEPRELREIFDGGDYKVVANIPYNITAAFLRQFLESDYPPRAMVLLVQKEVAERLTAGPGDMSLLALGVQFFATARIVDRVLAGSFYPVPAVDSAIIDLRFKSDPYPVDPKKFFRVARVGFAAKRKQLQNNLANGFKRTRPEILQIFEKIDLLATARAEDLSVDDWVRLTRELEGAFYL